MEKPSASEWATADRSDGSRESFRVGIRLDGGWKYQPLCGSPPARGQVRTCRFSVESLAAFVSFTIT